MRFPALAITHIHTEASNGLASELDPLIGGTLREIFGHNTASWNECFTKIERLVSLLDAPPPAPAVGILCITDHVNWRAHRYLDSLLHAAARDRRLCVGGEVATVEQDADGEYRHAPEVLVYGGTTPVEGPAGEYTGLSQNQLDELFARCRTPGRFEPQTCRVLEFCAERGYACALAHPLDGHDLSLEKTLELIGQARFVETINGGFPAASTRVLEAYLALHNRLVLGQSIPAGLWLRYPYLTRLAERIVVQGSKPIVALGGSDAHSHAFARVMVRFQAPRPAPQAVDLVRELAHTPTEQLLADGIFDIVGQPGSSLSVLDDVVRIVMRNLWLNRGNMTHPYTLARMLVRATTTVRGELGRRDRRQGEFIAEARATLPDLQELNTKPGLWISPARLFRRRRSQSGANLPGVIQPS